MRIDETWNCSQNGSYLYFYKETSQHYSLVVFSFGTLHSSVRYWKISDQLFIDREKLKICRLPKMPVLLAMDLLEHSELKDNFRQKTIDLFNYNWGDTLWEN